MENESKHAPIADSGARSGTIHVPKPILKNRPALSVLLAYLGGISLALNAGIAVDLAIILSIVISLFAVIVCFVTRLRSIAGVSLLAVVCCLGGMAYAQLSADYHSTPLVRLAKQATGRAQMVGEVQQAIKLREGELLLVQCDSLLTDSLEFQAHGLAALFIPDGDEDSTIPLPGTGHKLRCYGDLETLDELRNPYATSYDDHLRDRYGVHAKFYLTSRFDYEILNSVDSAHLLSWLSVASSSAREYATEMLSRAVSDGQSLSLAKALALGTRQELDRGTIESFRISGLTHLLAISGFNVAIVALLITQALELFGLRRRKWNIPVSMAAIAMYCQIVGFEASVLRAFVMVELFYLSVLLERQSDLANVAAFTALCHLVIDPRAIYDVGFQLSYSAVLGFALIYPELARVFKLRSEDHEAEFVERRPMRYQMLNAVLLSVAAFLATAPVVLLNFSRVSLGSIVANLPAIPIAAALTILSLLLIPLTALSSFLGLMYGDVIAVLVSLLFIISDFFSSGAAMSVTWDPRPMSIALVATALFVLLRRSYDVKQILARLGLLAAIGAIVILAVPDRQTLLTKGKLSVMFLDVGQGDATLVRTPSGSTYLFDFGNLRDENAREPRTPYSSTLIALGVDQVDAGFITHLHRDHYAGVFAALHQPGVGRLFTVADRTSDDLAFRLDSVTQERGIEVHELVAGQVLQLDRDVRAYVLFPDTANFLDRNDRSLVIRIVHGNTSVLLTGDIESGAEEELLSRYGRWLRSDVVKVAHHGSRSSSTPNFVRITDPQFAVISCGKRNRFRHPDYRVLGRWARSGAEICRTDRNGAILFESDGRGIKRIDWGSQID